MHSSIRRPPAKGRFPKFGRAILPRGFAPEFHANFAAEENFVPRRRATPAGKAWRRRAAAAARLVLAAVRCPKDVPAAFSAEAPQIPTLVHRAGHSPD